MQITNDEWDRMLEGLPELGMSKEPWGRGRPSRAEIEWQNLYLLRLQQIFRIAAGYIAQEYSQIDWVSRIAIMGSVARPLCKEVPRFSSFKRYRIEVWHECKDLDIAVWVDRTDTLNLLRKVRNAALNHMHTVHPTRMGVVQHQAEVFLLEPETDRYLGRLCIFGTCPKEGKLECRVEDCGSPSFLRAHEDFTFYDDAVSENRTIPLYARDSGLVLPPLQGLRGGDDTAPSPLHRHRSLRPISFHAPHVGHSRRGASIFD